MSVREPYSYMAAYARIVHPEVPCNIVRKRGRSVYNNTNHEISMPRTIKKGFKTKIYRINESAVKTI